MRKNAGTPGLRTQESGAHGSFWMLVLSRSDIRSLVSMERAIDLVSSAFADLSAGRAIAPIRTAIEVEKEAATTLVMPAFVPAAGALGVKVVSVFSGNAQRGLPTITAIVCLIDPATGTPLTIMDGAYLTALRTGAVSGAATKLLARADSRTLAVIGAGAQAAMQAVAVATVRPIEQIIVVARKREHLDQFEARMVDEWPALSAMIETTTDVGTAVRAADIICTATTSRTPVFDDVDVRPGTHINGVGSFTPAMQEVPAETVARCTVVVDQLEAALEEAGDLRVPLESGVVTKDHISRELGQLVSGDVSGRQVPEDVTFFKSVGNAVQDMAVGRFAFDEAVRRGKGQEVMLF